MQPSASLTRRGAQTPTGIAQHSLGISHRRIGNVSQLSGDPQHRGLALFAGHGSTQPQLGRDRAGTLTCRTTAITHTGAGCSARGLDSPDRAGHRPTALANNPESVG